MYSLVATLALIAIASFAIFRWGHSFGKVQIAEKDAKNEKKTADIFSAPNPETWNDTVDKL